MLVLDATPLIYLAKAGVLGELEQLDERLVIPQAVYEEVVLRGRETGEPDAQVIARLVENGMFEVQDTEDGDVYRELLEDPHLSEADRAVLSLADVENGVAVADEEHARSVADVVGVETRGTIYLLFRLLKQGTMDADAVRETVDRMVDAGWYCSTDLYADILQKLDEYEQ